MMDTDGDDRISKEEFDAHFENIGVEPNDALFRRDDVDKNGFIEFEEFGGNKVSYVAVSVVSNTTGNIRVCVFVVAKKLFSRL